MIVLLSSSNQMRKGIKWALIAHTVSMFSFLTIPAGISQNVSSVCYIDNRNFPGSDVAPPGPIGCPDVLFTVGTRISFAVMFPLNQWLADGLLVSRILEVTCGFDMDRSYSCIDAGSSTP